MDGSLQKVKNCNFLQYNKSNEKDHTGVRAANFTISRFDQVQNHLCDLKDDELSSVLQIFPIDNKLQAYR